jgi:type I restriction enzyme, S subunit
MEAGFSNHLTRLRVDQGRIMPRFMAYWLRKTRDSGYFSAHATQWVSQAAFKSSELRRMEMLLPSLDEQCRIVDILSRAEGIVHLRREARKKTVELIPALFLDMFGDPETNPKGLPIAQLGEFLTFVTSGSRGWAKYYTPEGDRFIRSLDVRMNEISNENAVFVNAPKGAEAERTRVQAGDVLLTITGSQIGRVAPVPEDIAGSFISQHVAILRLIPRLSPIFLSLFLSMDAGGQREIARLQYGQTKPGLNLRQIREFMIPVPPISIQQKFAKHMHQARALLSQQASATQKAEATFDALLAQTFCQTGASS